MLRYGHTEVTGGRYSKRHNQEEDEDQEEGGEELMEEEDGQEPEEARETKKRQSCLLIQLTLHKMSMLQLTGLLHVSRCESVC